jgi:hypothetical protein
MKMGLLGIMFLIFMTLKLCKIITWSWWLVCSPLIIWAVLILCVLTIMCVVYWSNSNNGRSL